VVRQNTFVQEKSECICLRRGSSLQIKGAILSPCTQGKDRYPLTVMSPYTMYSSSPAVYRKYGSGCRSVHSHLLVLLSFKLLLPVLARPNFSGIGCAIECRVECLIGLPAVWSVPSHASCRGFSYRSLQYGASPFHVLPHSAFAPWLVWCFYCHPELPLR
jgi:hypothetical protein